MSATMDRREALKRVAALMGGAISAPALAGLLSGCSAQKPSGATWKPVFLNDAQAAVITEVAEIMIPRTDTPGAIDVGVPAFIDTMLKACYPAVDQQRFISGLETFEAQSQREHQKAFLKLEPSQRAAFVQSVHDAAVEEQEKAPPGSGPKRPFILMTKELTLLGFFTSEPGATKVLQYQLVPGALRACIPLSEAGNGKTWALENTRPF